MALLESQKAELAELERLYPAAETCHKCVHGKTARVSMGCKCFSCACISMKNTQFNFEEEKR